MKNKNEVNKEMKNNERMNNRDDLGSIGIGAMIVFIALILVAAVASAVIIQTGEKLQQNAQQTGSDTQEEIGGKISIITVWVGDQSDCDTDDDTVGSADDLLDKCITLVYELAAGSEPMNEADVIWTITCDDGSGTMASVWGTFDGDIPAAPAPGTTGEYGDGTVDQNLMNLDTLHVDGAIKCIDGNADDVCTGVFATGDYLDDDILEPGQVYMISLKTQPDTEVAGTAPDQPTQNQGECSPTLNEQHELTLSVAGGGVTTEILSYTSVTEGQSIV
jgi:archaellin